MDETKAMKPHQCLRSVYECVTGNYTNSDYFLDISKQLMLPDSSLQRALRSLELAPEEETNMGDRQPPMHYRHNGYKYSVSICGRNMLFALQHVFYDLCAVDVVAYMGQEGFLNRAMFIHRGDSTIRIENDSLKLPARPEEYARTFLTETAREGEKILQTACELLNGDPEDKERTERKELEQILASVKLSA